MKKLLSIVLILSVLASSAFAAQRFHARRDVSDTATITTYSLNATTSIEIDPGGFSGPVNWIFSNGSNFDVWIKFEAAATDNDKEGIILMKGTNIPLVFGSGFYSGPISAIADTDNPTIYVTRY